ncbi:hypothetical protein ED208_14815 [Stagnimonas aquatica]|uniref:EF-hand domain-containing protein n=1 Tax=Stagnimonas aquatica TaxID=2689987 RepID=A0A3N0V2L8_9GAMM|nr:EF-hand domain-containing protein [Stagnimonas aquatica]ROH86708.1 hypothetical protein ED208_14815 [Stagnimonas aquatica]
MSIAAIGSTASSWTATHPKVNLADALFAKLDTNNQGYLSDTDLEKVLGASTSAETGGDSEAQTLFKALDSDSDGKVSKDELSSALEKVSAQLGEDRMRSQLGGPAGGPPPPPPGGRPDDEGLSQEQLSTMAADAPAGSSQASALSALAASFDEADTNEDGKVSFQEAMAFQQSQSGGELSGNTRQSPEANQPGVSDSDLGRLVKLIAQYLGVQDDSGAGSQVALSVSA